MVITSPSLLTAHQFLQGVCWPPTAETTTFAPLWPTPQVGAAMDDLWRILQVLQAPDSGWPAEVPQTAETLLPYVGDEIDELAEALALIGGVPTGSSAPQLLAAMSAAWLWAIAASTPIAMGLLEGVAASSRDRPAAHGVRLVPLLEIHTHDSHYSLDLAAQSWTEATSEFAPAALIELVDEPIAPMASAADWQTHIETASSQLFPSLQTWYAGCAIQLQLPGRSRCTAQVQLALKLVPLTLPMVALDSPTDAGGVDRLDIETKVAGGPTSRVWTAGPLQQAVETLTTTTVEFASPCLWPLDTEITFQDASALEAANRAARVTDLCRRVSCNDGSSSALTLLERVMNALAEPSTPNQPWWPGATLPLADVCRQVKWLWLRAGYEQVPMMSGIAGRCLRSEAGWQAGTVACSGYLSWQPPPEDSAMLDVLTGEWGTADAYLRSTDVVEVATGLAPTQPLWTVAELTARMTETIKARSPLLAMLMTGAKVAVSSPHEALFPELKPGLQTLWFRLVLTFRASPP
ncbi:MAG: hypothetical protein ACFBSG_20675 [Leptolyngbyaceae cyanobacterium]